MERARRPGLGELLGHLVAETRCLVTDYAHLAVLDARRATLNLAWLLVRAGRACCLPVILGVPKSKPAGAAR